MRATVVVPTRDHGPTLRPAVGSALDQTERDIEILIVGDGVSAAASAVARELESSDSRVRFIENPKGPGHGFRHRDSSVREAQGDNVLYLSDDDIWLPDHVERVCALLKRFSFVSADKLSFDADGPWLPKGPWDLGRQEVRSRVLAGRSTLSLSCVGHTRALYSRLAVGWRRDAADYPSTWREFLTAAGSSCATSLRPTVVILPDARRAGMKADERAAELERVRELFGGDAVRKDVLWRLVELEVERSAVWRAKLEGYAEAGRRRRLRRPFRRS